MTALDHNTPLTADELRGLESMCAALHAATETDPVVKDVAWRAFALVRAHREQSAAFDSLTETAHIQARMLGEITEACVAAEGDALRHRTQVAGLSAEVVRLKAEVEQRGRDLATWQHVAGQHQAAMFEAQAERDKARETASHMADTMAKVGPALLEAMRLAAAGDAAGAAAVLGDVAPEAPEGGETGG